MSTQHKFIVAGIGTEIGKTVASAVLTEKLQADYWKPVQAGDLDNSDSIKVRKWVSNPQTFIHEEDFKLNHPMSPHAAADRDGIHIQLDDFKIPSTENSLVIELAGGILVPLNHEITNLDFIKSSKLPVVLVVNFYLGSINHTLLSIQALQSNQVPIAGILFNGTINRDSQEVILKMSGCKNLGEIPQSEEEITPQIIKDFGKYIQL